MRRLVCTGLVVALSLTTIASALAQKATAQELAQKIQAAAGQQKWPEVAESAKALTELAPQNANGWYWLGYSLHAMGKLDEALAAHIKASEFPQTRPVGSYNAACAYALKNDKDKAFEWLEKAAAAGFNDVNQLQSDADLVSLHDDPRFAKAITAVQNAKPAAASQQAFISTTPRSSTRLAFFGAGGSAGQVVIDHGLPPWSDEYAKAVESKKYVDKRWRLGSDFWTTLDSNVDLTIGGTAIKAGYYYLTLEQKSDGSFVLGFHDPAVVRAKKLDAFMAPNYRGPSADVPMKLEKIDTVSQKLEFQLALSTDDQSKGTLSVRYGPYKLEAPLTLALGKSNS